MLIYRKGKLPCIYSELSWIRVHRDTPIYDITECVEDNKKYQIIFNTDRCISTILDDIGYLYVAIDIPEEIMDFNGKTGNKLLINNYYYRTYDVCLDLIEKNIPVSDNISETPIDPNVLEKMFDNSSCLNLLKDTRTYYYDFSRGEDRIGISDKTISKINDIEKTVIARYNLKNYSILKEPHLDRPATKRKAIAPTLRFSILRRDRHRCIFCGKDSTKSSLEVDHIVPVNLIIKLRINSSLLKAQHNLCTTCFECNRGKRDHLTDDDVEFYLYQIENGKISDKLKPILLNIKNLQNQQ